MPAPEALLSETLAKKKELADLQDQSLRAQCLQNALARKEQKAKKQLKLTRQKAKELETNRDSYDKKKTEAALVSLRAACRSSLMVVRMRCSPRSATHSRSPSLPQSVQGGGQEVRGGAQTGREGPDCFS